jgi:hypothetical protein
MYTYMKRKRVNFKKINNVDTIEKHLNRKLLGIIILELTKRWIFFLKKLKIMNVPLTFQ